MLAVLAIILSTLAIALQLFIIIWVLKGKNHFNQWLTDVIHRLDRLEQQQQNNTNQIQSKTQGLNRIIDPHAPDYWISITDILEGLERRFQHQNHIQHITSRGIPDNQDQLEQAIHLCVPLWNRSQNLKQLIELLDLHNQAQPNIIVHIADFGSTDCNVEAELQQSTLNYQLMLLKPPFSKSLALENLLNSPKIPNSARILFCDVDMAMPFDVYRRIRQTVFQNQSYYCPLVSFENAQGQSYGIEEDHGGHGFLAIYKSDIMAAGGFSHGLYRYKTTWGGEETDFARRISQKLIKVRRLEPEIIARYHPRPKDSKWYEQCSTIDFHEQQQNKITNAPRYSDLDRNWQLAKERQITLRMVNFAGFGNRLFQFATALAYSYDFDAKLILSRIDIDQDRFYDQKNEMVTNYRDFLDFGGHEATNNLPNCQLPTTIAEIFPNLPFENESREPNWLRKQGQHCFEDFATDQQGYLQENYNIPPIYQDSVLEGYFFSRFNYFHHLDKIREAFTLNSKIQNYIEEHYPVQENVHAIHMRFGHEGDNYNPMVPSKSFYHKVLRQLQAGTLWLFSDQPQLAEQVIKSVIEKTEKSFTLKLRRRNKNEPDYLDLFLMSRCNSITIGMSSFSAWAAILSNQDKQQVFYHHHFIKKHGRSAPHPNWIEIADDETPSQAESLR